MLNNSINYEVAMVVFDGIMYGMFVFVMFIYLSICFNEKSFIYYFLEKEFKI